MYTRITIESTESDIMYTRITIESTESDIMYTRINIESTESDIIYTRINIESTESTELERARKEVNNNKNCGNALLLSVQRQLSL